MRSDVPSTLPFNCLVSVVGLGFLSATFVKLEHQSKYEGAASGVVPVMKLFEDSFSYSNQLGQRQGWGGLPQRLPLQKR